MFGKRAFSLGLFVFCLLAVSAGGETFTFDNPEAWGRWEQPVGLVNVDPDGVLRLVKFRKDINAALDAQTFIHPTQKLGEVSGGIWRAGSSSATAGNLIDGDSGSFWQPDPDDDLVDWVVDIDLGRPVLANSLRLRFPDEEGARPFRQFRVFVATGARIQSQDDVFKYEQIYVTTQPNVQTEIEVNLGDNIDTTRVLSAGIDLDPVQNSTRTIQFIRFVGDEKSLDASLAEIEVTGVGDNVSLGVLERGGSFDFGLLARDPETMFDGNMDTSSQIATSVGTEPDWRKVGLWWQVDLGALFWLDELFIYFRKRGEGLSSFLFENLTVADTYHILASEGQRTISGGIDFDELIVEPRFTNPRKESLRHYRYVFEPRKVRYLFWFGELIPEDKRNWRSQVLEFMLFSPGYPAEVSMRSEFIDLGDISGDGRPKAIRSLQWDIDQPPSTRLRLRSRSGNGLSEIYTFHDRAGGVVTESRWTSAPVVLRGKVDTTVVVGEDWGEWSNFYQVSGESFQSETPRRFVQLEMILSTEDPDVAPSVRSLSIEFEDALVLGARGNILPRQTGIDEQTHFNYTFWPVADDLDSGFDRLRFSLDGELDLDSISLRIGQEGAQALSVSRQNELVLVDLDRTVLSDSVAIGFSARLQRNASVFSLELGNSQRPGVWQSVEPDQRNANIIYVPDLADSRRIVADLRLSPTAFTPNGDGSNDTVEITFNLLKANEVVPKVEVYDLAGNRVVNLQQPQNSNQMRFVWDGRDAQGSLVPPGTYILGVDAGTAAGDDTANHTVVVAY
jgi:hypothetical protein